MTELERLEATTGRLHTTRDFIQVRAKAADYPGQLTDEEIAVLDFFGGASEAARARAARATATAPPIDPAARPAAAAQADLVKVCQAIGNVWEVIGKVFKFCEDMNEKNKGRNARIAALEARVAALDARPAFTDKGAWKPEVSYQPGDLVTQAGDTYICDTLHVSMGAALQPAYFRLLAERHHD